MLENELEIWLGWSGHHALCSRWVVGTQCMMACCVKLTTLYRYWFLRLVERERFKPVPDKAKLGNDGWFERSFRNAKGLTSPRVTGRRTTHLLSTSACRHQMDSEFSLGPWRTWGWWVMTRILFMPSLRAIDLTGSKFDVILANALREADYDTWIEIDIRFNQTRKWWTTGWQQFRHHDDVQVSQHRLLV